MTFIKSLREEAGSLIMTTGLGQIDPNRAIDQVHQLVTTTALKTLEEVERLEDLANSDLDFLRSIKGNSVIQHLRAEIKNDV